MSLLPLILKDALEDIYNPSPLIYDQHFGLGLLNDDLHQIQPSQGLMKVPLQSGYIRPWRHLNSGESTFEADKSNFKLSLDVLHFKPEEISVKVSNNDLIIEGKHEERKDNHGFVSRQFSRRYTLPENVDVEKLESNLSTDGILSLVAPKKIDPSAAERTIPIIKTNQPALKPKAAVNLERAVKKENKMET